MSVESKIKEALAEIERGVQEIIGFDYIKELVTNYFKEGKTYTIKAGFDPTAPDLHLGHTVLLQKLATFQKYGAKVFFLIGDFTGMIGDPSGKSETRKPLSKEQVLQNAKTYEEQVYKVLDASKMEIVFNSNWLDSLGTRGMIELAAKFSVARMLERDDFEKRFKAQSPISIVEFFYPLLQGYDSVALNCDIEFGGTDQKFNLLMGRHLQRAYGLEKEQSVVMVPLLEGLDGVNKMSKSLGNYVGITQEPKEMFGRILSISDSLMWRYYELLSTKSLQEIAELKQGVEKGELHPKVVKENLALEIIARYYDINAANAAKEEFARVFSKDELPSDIPVFTKEKGIWIAQLAQECGLCDSNSEALRAIKQGALKLNGKKVEDSKLNLQESEYILQIGKRKFAKVIIK
ncbi:tyrosine--tRNA ligase [Helicobacter winghamensis]|uniref:Tyrosine--tRNA ligase n=1 Tax=Helicobacter winghamensis TaxID=157268 RepID=A0A2N3PJZ5_9HELI|nr:tyrosine--tRNA ligase [Helicobacter winghamensis]EEO26206.1 tyrosine--tRNA ligase [Helicobacter winghamensis ATCC BAA-430]PKT77335.1 tyrosine--tRNA ligase [Helicobacter winghamensis]PKT77542.1 tyrosine--tRNA ligase [Helicobacter winghamensis]PKT77908.1 tyrosine--tRNA ligase [Helicobacter winghamensis]PKT81501.1 tyrosine--tRNA ligase [Helicobacter winghamensis]